jgi:hypothetical protein
MTRYICCLICYVKVHQLKLRFLSFLFLWFWGGSLANLSLWIFNHSTRSFSSFLLSSCISSLVTVICLFINIPKLYTIHQKTYSLSSYFS